MASTRELERIEHEIEAIRRTAGERLGEIEERISPRRFMQRGVSALRDSYPMRNMNEVVSDGAIPMLLIAAGIGLWTYNVSRRNRWGEPIGTIESDEWRSAPSMEELDRDEVLADESVREHHVHIADSRRGAKTHRPPSPQRLLDIEHSYKSASGSARAFER